jgi:hypothetical protein
MVQDPNKNAPGIVFAVAFGAMLLGAKGIGPALAHHAPVVVAALVAGAFAGALVAITLRAVGSRDAWPRAGIIALATVAVFATLRMIG